MRKIFLLLWVFLSPAHALDCQSDGAGRPDVLFAVKEAKDPAYLNCRFPNGWQPFQVMYGVKVPYPAERIIQEIKDTMSQKGWQAQTVSLLKSGSAPAPLWSWSEQAVNQPIVGKMDLRTWVGEWKKGSGDFVQYVLSYTMSAAGEEVNQAPDLEVLGTFVKASQVSLMQNQSMADVLGNEMGAMLQGGR